MDDLKGEIDALIAQSQGRLCQIIEFELQSCWLAIDFGYLELQMGALDRAEREVGEVGKRCQNILRLLPEVADEEQRNRFKAQLDKLLSPLTPGEPQ